MAALAWLFAALIFPGARRTAAAPPISQWVHKQWRTEEGLPQNSVYCIAQDSRGFLWFGTENGLGRYDGVLCETFAEQKHTPAQHDFVSSVLAARDGSLWVGTRTGGLTHYHEDLAEPGIPTAARERVQALAETPDGSLWIGTPDGLKQLRGQIYTSFGPQSGLPSADVTALLVAKNGVLWIGCGNGTIAALENNQFHSYTNALALRQTAVMGLAAESGTGDILVAYDRDGLFRLHKSAFTPILILGRKVENIQALCVSRDDAIWVGTQNDGLFRLKDGEDSQVNLQNGLEVDNVFAVMEDAVGSIWVGTLHCGLHRLYVGAVTTAGKSQGLPTDEINCLLEISPGKYLIGTKNAGAFHFANGEFSRLDLPGLPKDIRALLRAKDGSVWMGGGESGGLFYHDGAEWHKPLTLSDGLAADDVSALYQSQSGEIWVGSHLGGITVIDPISRKPARTLTNDFLRTHLRCFGETEGGKTLWIGTQDGLVQLKNGVLTPHFLKGYPDICIRTFYTDAEDVLWIGTRDDGLLRLSTNGLFSFDSERGLRQPRVYQLLPVGDHLWLAGNHGIERASFAELNAVASGRAARIASLVLTERDGLRTVECGSDAGPSALAAPDDTLWFATRRGLAAVRPEKVGPLPRAPRPFITKVRLDETSVRPETFKQAPAGVTLVQFSYTAVDLRHGNLSYAYKLDGVDRSWVEAGRDREAVYHDLKPGAYVFHVRAARDQPETDSESTLAFSVAPRFYQTALFLWSSIIAGAGAIRGLYAWRVAGMKRRTQTLQKLVQVRTAELEEEVAHRKHAEEQQIALNAELETRVEQRTAELTHAYEDLRTELRERQRVEMELAASEARLRRVVDSGMVGILFWRPDGQILEANETLLSMIGYSQEELKAGRISWTALTPQEYAPLDRAALEEIHRTGVCTPFEKECLRRDGSRFPVLIGGASLASGDEDLVCFVLDISERKAAEESVRQLAQSLEQRVRERTVQLAQINQQLAAEVQERKRVAVALSAFSQLGQKLHGARTEKEAATIIVLTAKSLVPHDLCSIELYDRASQLYPVIRTELEGEPTGREPMRSSISVPIRNGSRVIGVIGLRSTALDAFDAADANTLQALGDYCGGALDRIHAEEARREMERRFGAFMANAPALAWMKDAELRYIFTNPVFQKFLGLDGPAIEDKRDRELWPEATAERIRANDLLVFETAQPLETQETLKRADQETRTLLTLRFPFTTASGERLVAGMAVDITEQKRAEEALRRLPQSILEAQEQERRRLARELHDSVNQAIASAKFRIQTAENQILRNDPKWQDSCSKSKEMLDLVLKQVRHLSHDLRPGELDDFGILPAARTAFHEFEARTGITVQFRAEGLENRLDPAIESTLYRVIQEALTNIEKHSRASLVTVELARGKEVSLDICDNGVGFRNDLPKGGTRGLGLMHMQERASLIGGSYWLKTSPGQGVHIHIAIPYQPRPS